MLQLEEECCNGHGRKAPAHSTYSAPHSTTTTRLAITDRGSLTGKVCIGKKISISSGSWVLEASIGSRKKLLPLGLITAWGCICIARRSNYGKRCIIEDKKVE